MPKFLRRIFDIQEGEGKNALLLFSYGLLIIASLSILKPVRNSLFITRFGVEKLPYVYMLVALVSAGVALLYSRLSRSIRINRLIHITFAFSNASLVLFWWLLHVGHTGAWFLYALYTWVAVFGVITGSQFWLLANDVYHARQAKRLFGLIGAGSISGGILGGYLAQFLATRLGTENLFFFCIGFLILCHFLVIQIWSRSEHFLSGRRSRGTVQRDASADQNNPIRLIIKSRHLILMTGLICLGILVADLVDYQFSAVASSFITDADRLTAFFGFWISTVNIISLVIQLFLTGRIIKHLGVSVTLFFLPLALLSGAAAILIQPALWSAILIRIGDGGFKHSINNAGLELLWLPIPADIKNKAKSFIDVFLKNLSTGLGGLILITLTAGMGFSIRQLSLAVIALIGLWAFFIWKVKQEYINSFRQAIEKRSINLDEQVLNLEDATVFNTFLQILEGKNERQILYGLDLLAEVHNQELVPYLHKLIQHPSQNVRVAVLRMAVLYDDLDFHEQALSMAESGSSAQRMAAINYLYQKSPEPQEILKSYLAHPDLEAGMAAMQCAAGYWRESKEFRRTIDLQKLFASMLEISQDSQKSVEKQIAIKVNTALAIGTTRDPDLQGPLHTLLQDPHPDVLMASVNSLAQSPNQEFIPELISHLGTKHIRKAVRECLAEYQETVIPCLRELFQDESVIKKTRSAIPRVLALIDSQKAVNFLCSSLGVNDISLRYQVIRALNRLRNRFPGLRFDRNIIKEHIGKEIELYRSILRAWIGQMRIQEKEFQRHRISGALDPQRVRKLLTTALGERLELCLERIFRLLGLLYPSKDIWDAFHVLGGRNPALQANAIEFLDNILDSGLKKNLIPIVETARAEALTQKDCVLNLSPISEPDSIRGLLQGQDNWLKACSLFLAAAFRYSESLDLISRLSDTADPLVKETAVFCQQQMFPFREIDQT